MFLKHANFRHLKMSNIQPNFLPTQKLFTPGASKKLEAVEPEMKISIVRVKAQPRKHKAPPWAGVTWPPFFVGGEGHWQLPLVGFKGNKEVGRVVQLVNFFGVFGRKRGKYEQMILLCTCLMIGMMNFFRQILVDFLSEKCRSKLREMEFRWVLVPSENGCLEDEISFRDGLLFKGRRAGSFRAWFRPFLGRLILWRLKNTTKRMVISEVSASEVFLGKFWKSNL